ncbi:XkdF-like putative serine protease domain-containing protein [Nitratireductor sp. OM-1]|uniref:XkdF-like putative serine protease domain-containing protein n=1 Tax=Nitratireductor sp. OM-1 TaxID=1756988 RepID=UPI0013AF3A05|nr:XkdF-like putative serine protease domain-containing protein [Nitratireductor sp. OM-1]
MFQESRNSAWGNDGSAATTPRVGAPAKNTPTVQFKKADEEQQLVYGEVYAPTVPDSQGDFMTREAIQEMAHGFMRRGLVTKIDVQHTREESGCYVVESFIARDDDPTFIPGSWVLGVKIPDPSVWNLVKSGELNGFSLDGLGVRVDTVLEINVPETITGQTEESDGHRHTFFVKYDDQGAFLGGWTDEGPDGFRHEIRRGTLTETANGHAHRFSFVEGVLDARIAS